MHIIGLKCTKFDSWCLSVCLFVRLFVCLVVCGLDGVWHIYWRPVCCCFFLFTCIYWRSMYKSDNTVLRTLVHLNQNRFIAIASVASIARYRNVFWLIDWLKMWYCQLLVRRKNLPFGALLVILYFNCITVMSRFFAFLVFIVYIAFIVCVQYVFLSLIHIWRCRRRG